jgi:hypothetical protein
VLIATVSTQRSGTKLLGNCFKAGTVVTPFGEVFNPDVPHVASFHTFAKANGDLASSLGSDAALDAYFAGFKTICGIYQIDVMYNQLEIPISSWNPHPYFGIYGYFRASGTVVIDLRRNVFDTFVSMKFLENCGGKAHVYTRQETLEQGSERLLIDENEYISYRDNIFWHQSTIERAMQGYEWYYPLDYRDLEAGQSIPDSLRTLICRAAAEKDMCVDERNIQILPPPIFPSGVDYSTVFKNFDQMRDAHAG